MHTNEVNKEISKLISLLLIAYIYCLDADGPKNLHKTTTKTAIKAGAGL